MKVILSCILMLTVCHHTAWSAAVGCADNGGCGQPVSVIINPSCPCPKSKPAPKIPSGFEVHEGLGAYKLVSGGFTWNEARNACIKEGGHLPVPSSQKEDDLLNAMQNKAGAQYVWLGLHDQFAKGDWTTVLDQPLGSLGYAGWDKGEPNSNGVEHCVCATGHGMNDLTCDGKLSYFCKIDLS